MVNPHVSESVDETLVQPSEKPTIAPPPPPPADLSDDFSGWTWTGNGAPTQMSPAAASESSAASEAPADRFDDTLVIPSLDAPPKKNEPETFDQTLVNPPSHLPDSDTTAQIDATLVRPTDGPVRGPTVVPKELAQTLVPLAEAAASSDIDTATDDPAGPVKPVTAVRPMSPRTSPIDHGRPTQDANRLLHGTDSKSVKVPSFQVEGDRYEILGTLGRGGMGVVYKARDKKLNRLVALKMILSGAHASPETLMRFKIEAEAVAKLQHPNIVQIFDIGERDGHPFFSLEYLDGGCLHNKLDGAPQQPKHAAAVIETLSRAIHYAHQRGIVHRDMKPANVLLAGDGTLKITDFGLAKQIDTEDSGQTGTEAILGTPTYMAPEQAAGMTREVGPAADIYALGAMLYEMLTGRPPFRGKTIMDTLQQVQFVEPVQPRRLQPNAPLDLQTICLKCLNKEPEKRYVSAEALADDLRAYLDNRPIKARPTPFVERVYKWMRRQPMQAALVAVSFVALCGLIFGVVNHLQQQSELRRTAESEAATAKKNEGLAMNNAALAVKAKEEETKRREDAENAKQAIQKESEAKEKQRKRATENFKQARAAVDQLTILAQQNLVDRPGLEKVRDDLLNRVVVFYEEFIKTNTEENLTQDKGQAYRRLGDVQQMLGKNTDAAVSYQQACDSCTDMLAKDPKSESARRELAETSINQWVVLADLGKQDLADQALKQAHATLTALHKDFPTKTRYVLDLAMCENDFAISAYLAGKLSDAESHAQKALKYLSDAQGPNDSDPSFRLERARAYDALGLLYTAQAGTSEKPDDERSKASDQFALALTEIKPLVKRMPETTKYVKELGAVYTNLGILLKARKDQSQALAIYQEAIDLFDGLAKKYPDVTDYRHLAALNRSNRGDLLGQQMKFDAARTDLNAAIEALARLAKDFPKRPIYRLGLAETYNRLGVIEEADQQRDRARQSWERAEKLLEDLVQADQKRGEYRKELERTLDFLILFHKRQAKEFVDGKKWTDAGTELTRLVELRLKLEQLFPDDGKNKEGLASTRLALAANQMRARNLAEAEKTLADLQKNRKDVPTDWGKWHEVAIVACACMELADRDQSLSAEARNRLRESRTEQCLLLLREAIDHNENIVLGDDDFKTLRDNPDFKEMLAEIERKRKKAGEP